VSDDSAPEDTGRDAGSRNVSAQTENSSQDGGREDLQQITDRPAASRLELVQDGQVAYLSYRLRGNRFVLLHTEVPETLEGHGLGGRLVRAAIDRALREGRVVVPLCPFARTWLKRHPDAGAGATVDWGPDQDS
jgi:predicted GNAT family acetyltransferase